MAQQQPVNAAPATIMLGVSDKSRKRRLYEEAARGIHVPMVYSWAQYGPVDEAQLVSGNTLQLTYGDETLNPRSKYASHVTPYLTVFLNEANSILFERILPKDHGPKASLRLFVDVNETEVPEYEREIDGSFKRDKHDALVPTGSNIQGIVLEFSVEPIPTVTGSSSVLDFGKGNVKTGTMTSNTSQPSKKFPIMDLVAPHFGELGNAKGIRIWSPTMRDITPMKDNILDKDNAYPFRFSLIERTSELTSAHVVPNISGELFDDFTLMEGLIDTDYNKERYFGNMVVDNYSDLSTPYGQPLRYGPIGSVHLYQDNIDLILEKIIALESQQNYSHNDLANRPNTDKYRVNLFGLQQPNGIPYQTIRFNTSNLSSIRLTPQTDLYLSGAYDGTTTDAELAAAVEQRLDQWADPDSPYQDIISYPCSYFWDSGFPLSTKYKMGKFIAERKNTNVSVSTYISGERPLTISEEISRGVAIVERLRAYAESDYFATPTMRANCVTCSGKMILTSYKRTKRTPCNIELARMVAKLCAGSSFRGIYLFDKPPNNIFSILEDVSSLYAPMRVRNREWAAGLMYPEKINQRQVYFPASKTVYGDDTSVLNSVINAIILAECETVGDMARRYFSGALMPKYTLKGTLEDYVRDKLTKKFGELTRIEVEVTFTDADNHRGYSWTLILRVYLPMMRTVQTLYIEAYDYDDLPAESASFVS